MSHTELDSDIVPTIATLLPHVGDLLIINTRTYVVTNDKFTLEDYYFCEEHYKERKKSIVILDTFCLEENYCAYLICCIEPGCNSADNDVAIVKYERRKQDEL